MPVDEDARRAEAARWLTSAAGDLAGADAILADPTAPDRIAAFLAQQAAEKSLKAALFFCGVPVPKTHRLDRLRDLVPLDWTVHHLDVDLIDLSGYSIEARYPDAGEDVAVDDAHAAADRARRIHAALNDDLARRGVNVAGSLPVGSHASRSKGDGTADIQGNPAGE
jgi:HEPN domain-containing protein